MPRRPGNSAVNPPPARFVRRSLPLLVALLLGLLAGPGARAAPEAAPDPSAARLRALVLPAPPRLDGRLEDWPPADPAHEARIDRAEQAHPRHVEAWAGPDDLSATVRVGTDGESLYLAAEVRDDRIFHPGEPWWHGDAIELFLDTDLVPGAPRADHFTPGCWQIFLMPYAPDVPWGVVYHGAETRFDDGGLRGVEVAHRTVAGGYVLEARLPLANFGIDGRVAHEVGFALALDDADEQAADPGTYLSWNGGFDLYRDPRAFGTLALPGVPAAAGDAPGSRAPWGWLLLALALVGPAVLLLAGPGARVVARLGPLPKVVGLGLVALLALLYLLGAQHTEAAERDRVRAELEALARDADAVAREADALGVLGPDEATRQRTLESLLAGREVPALLAPEAVGFVRFAEGPPEGEQRIRIASRPVFHLDPPLRAETLLATIELGVQRPGGEDAPAGVRLGTLEAEADGGLLATAPLVAARVEGRRAEVRIELGGDGPWSRLRVTPAPGVRRANLLRLEAVRIATDGGYRMDPVELSETTDDGVPVLGGRIGPGWGTLIPAGGQAEAPLPWVLGADRLWLVLGAPQAFPRTLGEAPVAEVEILYADGPSTVRRLVNGVDLVAEVLPPGIARPPTMPGRVAWSWLDAGGARHARELVPVALDPERRPRRVVVRHTTAVPGDLDVVAATVVRSADLPAGGRLVLHREAADAHDRVSVTGLDPDLGARLGDPGADAVRLEAAVGPDDHPVRLALGAPLPARVREKHERMTVAVLTCLALALLLLAFLAADAVERFRRLTLRLAFGVLLAALIPLTTTMLLVDHATRERLEAEQVARARAALASVRAALGMAERRTEVAAEELASWLAVEGEAGPERIESLVRLHGAGALGGAGGALALVAAPDRPTLRVAVGEDGRGLAAPRYLADHEGARGLHLSPWDGLLVVGGARTDEPGRPRVTLGAQLGEDFLASPLEATPGAAVAVLDAEANPIVAGGRGARALAASLAGERAAIREGLRVPGDAVRNHLPGRDGRDRLALVSPLALGGGERAWLAVGLDRSGIDAALGEQREQLVWLALFGLVLVVGVASLTARRVAEPVRELVRVTDAVRRGAFDVEVPPAGADEVGDLTVAFDQMRRDLKRRVGDLDRLRRAQEELASTLDQAACASTALDLLGEEIRPDVAVLLDATAPDAPLTVLAERGRRTSFADRPFTAAPAGWLAEALAGTAPVEVTTGEDDPRAAAEGPVGRRLVDERPAWIAVPLRAGAEVTGVVVLAFDEAGRVPGREARRLLEPLAGVVALALHNARLYRLAALDDATRLPGRTAFEAALRADVDRAMSGGAAVVLLRVGLDHLERVTLRRGVDPARELLRALGLALRAVEGGRRRLGRLREDELAVRLVGPTREEALAAAERVRERLARVEVAPEAGGEAVRTGITIGLARCPEDAASVEFLLDAAGRALATGRREGGDRVEEAARLDSGAVDVPPFEEGAVFRAERMVRVVESARRAARSDASVLVTGETGTGKEVIANLIHRRSVRADRPFVSVNCAAFPATLLESELFGYERGAFTGAERRREGRFELADGGTLFLDEIAEMSPDAQVKLLRVLQERQFTRLGGTRTVSVDVRIVAATNRDPEAAMADGTLREDLYYRLNVIRLELPPLRERREEIPPLVERFLAESRRRMGRGPRGLTTAAMDMLYRHPWPGNVRELKNVIERCAVLCDAELAGPEHLRLDGGRAEGGPAPRAAPTDDLNERQRLLLDHLARHGRCTNREYQELTSTSARTGLRDLQDLIDRGLVVREGRRRGASYRLA